MTNQQKKAEILAGSFSGNGEFFLYFVREKNNNHIQIIDINGNKINKIREKNLIGGAIIKERLLYTVFLQENFIVYQCTPKGSDCKSIFASEEKIRCFFNHFDRIGFLSAPKGAEGGEAPYSQLMVSLSNNNFKEISRLSGTPFYVNACVRVDGALHVQGRYINTRASVQNINDSNILSINKNTYSLAKNVSVHVRSFVEKIKGNNFPDRIVFVSEKYGLFSIRGASTSYEYVICRFERACDLDVFTTLPFVEEGILYFGRFDEDRENITVVAWERRDVD